jgi:alpha-galactosidase
VPPILYTTWFDIGCELDAKLFMTLVDNAAEIGQEIIMMDAGWYHGVIERPYSNMQGTWNAISNPLGNWEEGEEKTRFPSLRALGDYVRSKGMQFGLWFEPERAGPDSVLAEQHPDWLVDLSHESEGRRRWKMVYFGHPEVPEYFCTILDRYIKECGLRYIRWDQNNELLPYWQKLDAPNRRGLSQIRHLEGMHRVEDWVREYHPEVILESCAGGGERIDLATLRRRQTIWVSDQTMDPDIVRFHLEGLNHFVPGNALVAGFSPPTSTYEKPGYVFKDIDFQSYFGGAFGSAGRLHEWPAALKAQMRKHVDAYKKIRKYLAEDFYLLLPQPRDLWSWEAWQFHIPRPTKGLCRYFEFAPPSPPKTLFSPPWTPAPPIALRISIRGRTGTRGGKSSVGRGAV